MTKAERFNKLVGYEEEPHIQAFKMILAELSENNPGIEINWCLPKYRDQIKWLNEEHKGVVKE